MTLSVLTAVACHLILFNFVTIVFFIDAEPLKPKLFFLGSILSPHEVIRKENDDQPPRDGLTEKPATLDQMEGQTGTKHNNPFAIESIQKPLIADVAQNSEKTMLKSTFDAVLEETPQPRHTDSSQPTALDLNIQPYQSLHLKSVQPQIRQRTESD